MEKVYTGGFESELGAFSVAATTKGLAYVGLPSSNGRGLQGWIAHYAKGAKCIADRDATRIYVDELQEFLAGKRCDFSIPIDLRATIFQHAVYRELQRLPYGTTCSYGELAARIGNPKAMRAVGTANAMNPIAIVIPCHRVVAAGGKLGGYAGGRELKERLLALESKQFSLCC